MLHPNYQETPDYWKMPRLSALLSKENMNKPLLPEKKNYLSQLPSELRLKKDSDNQKEKTQSKEEENKTLLMLMSMLLPQMVPNSEDRAKLS